VDAATATDKGYRIFDIPPQAWGKAHSQPVISSSMNAQCDGNRMESIIKSQFAGEQQSFPQPN